MNWLAHLLLSEATPEFRLGGMLPDLAPASALAHLPLEFQRGIQRHRQIDAYTDRHPIFRQSVGRFSPPLRRFGGILTDIFYDHFLTRHWASFSPIPLPDFVSDVHAAIDHHAADLPADTRQHFHRIRAASLLSSYGEIQGIRNALRGLSRRLRRPFDLTSSIPIFELHYDSFEADFIDFFPELLAYVHEGLP